MNSAGKATRELISFYLDAGVDALLGEEPIDRFADERAPAAPPAAVRSPSPPLPHKGGGSTPPPAPTSPEAAIMSARAAAKSAKSLEELRALLEAFEGCMLRATATQLVFADGNPTARVMFVGE